MPSRLILPALFTGSLLACTGGGDDDTEPGTDGPVARAPRTTLSVTPDPLTRATAARFEFTSDQPGSTFTCSLDGRPGEPCLSPFEITVLDGEHSFSVFATNPAGLTDISPEAFSWRVDTVAPVARLLNAPAAIDNSEYPSFVFETDDGEGDTATYTCRIDERTPVPCLSPWFTPLPVSKGPHTFEVIATDAAGNVQVQPTTHAWTADLLLPDTYFEDAPVGTVASRDATVTFGARNANPPVRFECHVDVQPWEAWLPCTSPLQLTGLLDGVHTIEIRAVDGITGVTDPSPAVRTWSIDTTPPTLSITSNLPASTNDNTPTFTFVASPDTTMRECRMISSLTPDPAFASCTSPYTAAALPEGPARFEARASDILGNSIVVGRDVTIDMTPPTVAITVGPSAPTNDNTPTFEFTTVGATAVHCRLGSTQWLSCTSPYTSGALSENPHTLDVRATDGAGNQAFASRSFSVDQTPPTVSFTGGPNSQNGPTADTTPTFTFNVSGAATGGVTCRLGNGDFVPCASPYTLPAVADGSHTLTVRAVDGANNQRLASRAFSVNSAPLSLTFTGGPIGGATRDRSPAFTWITTGAVYATECRHDAGTFTWCTDVLLTDLVDGQHTLEVQIRDDLGHIVRETVSFTVDTVAPTADVTGGPTGTISTTDVSFTFVTGGAPVATECRVFPGNLAHGPYAPCTSPHAMTLQPPSSPYAYTFEVRVRDAAGNQWSAYRSFTYSAP